MLAKNTSVAPESARGGLAQNFIQPPPHLKYAHWKELTLGSAIAPEIAAANFQSLAGDDVLERLADHALDALGAHSAQYATGPVRRIQKTYESVTEGGWWCSGVDPLNDWEPMEWGQFKPDHPREGWQEGSDGEWHPTGKLIKYEAPKGVSQRAHFLVGGVDWASVLNDPTRPIALTEGSKKGAGLLSLDVAAISLTGVDGWSLRKDEHGYRTLLPELAIFCNPQRPITLVFDADTKATAVQRVEWAKRLLSKALIHHGVRSCNIRIARWDSELGKGIDDVLVAHGPDAWTHIYQNAQSYSDFRIDTVRRVRAAKAGLFKLIDAPDAVLNQRYLAGIDLPTPGSILGIVSPMGTGKTEATKHLKQQFFERHPDGLFDGPGYRNGLGQQTAARIGSEHLHDLECEQGQYTQMLIEHSPALQYCLDSLHRRANATLRAISQERTVCWVLDEADAVIRHLLRGGTLGGRRQQIQMLFKDVAQAIIQSGGYIVAAEADLTQLCLDFLKELTGAPTSLVQNQHQPHPWEVTAPIPLSKEGKPAPVLMREAAFQSVLSKLNLGQCIFFGTDDQTLGEAIAAAAAEAEFIVWRLDGNTSEEPWVKAFLADPNGYLETHGAPHLIIATTTAESGLSINEGYVSERVVYWSHLEFRAAVQIAGRCRGNTPLTVFATESVKNLSDDPDSFDPDAILKVWQQNASDSGLSVGVHTLYSKDALKPALEAVSGEGELFHRYAAMYQARANISGAALRANLLDALAEQGHQIREIEIEIDPDLRQIYRAEIDRVKDQTAQAFAEAEADQPPTWARKIAQSNSATRENRIKAEKILLLEDYPGLPADDKDFVKDIVMKGGGSALRAHTLAWMSQHPQIAQQIDRLSWAHQLAQPFVWLPSVKHMSVQVHALRESGLLELARLDEYRQDTPEAIAVAQWAIAHAAFLYRLFRLQISPSQSTIQICNKLLRKLAYKPKIARKEGGRGEQVKIWAISNRDDGDRQAIWQALDQKWASFLAAETNLNREDSDSVASPCHSKNTLMQTETTPPLVRLQEASATLRMVVNELRQVQNRDEFADLSDWHSPALIDQAWLLLTEHDPDEVLRLESLINVS
ncbi:MAG: DUF3854 domain-containing protein [Cyanobacteria bacterium P01_D01_bin.44]